MNKKLIVVDVQPGYHQYHSYLTRSIVDVLPEYDEVLWFFVGTKFELDTEADVTTYLLYDFELDEAYLERITFVEKTYGWLRGWLDTGVDEDDIITIFRYMLVNNISDSRDLTRDDFGLMGVVPPAVSDCIYHPSEFEPDLLKEWAGSDIVGGSVDACLLEIELTMDALEVSYQRKANLTY